MALQTDKLLLTAFVTVLVGFVTAALAIVRLVNDKENKTTDYRQAWTDSLRHCLADLISNVNLLAAALARRHLAVDSFVGISNRPVAEEDPLQGGISAVRDNADNRLREEDAHVRDVRTKLYQSYALTRLHFKPNDLSFARVEQKFDVIMEMLDKLTTLHDKDQRDERKALREKIFAAAAELTGYARDILKTEWEAVKRGEKTYQRTKLWSLIGGGVALVTLLMFGGVTAWTLLKADGAHEPAVTASAPLPQMTAGMQTGSQEGRAGADAQVGAPRESQQQSVTIYGLTQCDAVRRTAAAIIAAPRPCDGPSTVR